MQAQATAAVPTHSCSYSYSYSCSNPYPLRGKTFEQEHEHEQEQEVGLATMVTPAAAFRSDKSTRRGESAKDAKVGIGHVPGLWSAAACCRFD